MGLHGGSHDVWAKANPTQPSPNQGEGFCDLIYVRPFGRHYASSSSSAFASFRSAVSKPSVNQP
jgi:hypothetical protein